MKSIKLTKMIQHALSLCVSRVSQEMVMFMNAVGMDPNTVAARFGGPHTVLVADDHRVVLMGLVKLLEEDAGFRVDGTAADGWEVLHSLQQAAFDVVLLDFHLPELGGIELIRKIRMSWPSQKILVLTFDHHAELAKAVIAAGASGFITKSSDPEQLLGALRKVAAGEHYLEPSLMEAIVFSPHQDDDAARALSPREQEVLNMLAAGMSNRRIAERLQLSEKTVSTHRVRLSKKLNASSLSDLMQHASKISGRAAVA